MSIVVTGVGVAAAGCYGKSALVEAMFAPPTACGVLTREGRVAHGATPAPGYELPEPPALLGPRVARTAGLSARIAIAVLAEAWQEAGLDALDPERIGLVVGGGNLFEREMLLARDAFAQRMAFWPPRFSCAFLDTDVAALCASHFRIEGFCKTVAAASASGLVAVLEAADAVRSGRVDACVALGAMQDISALSCASFAALGALGSHPAPLDRDSDGLVYGEGSAALVLTRAGGAASYGRVLGYAQVADGTRGPEPSVKGQMRAVTQALALANRTAADVAYINAHATGTPAGDAAELATFSALGLRHAPLNATKSLTGHGLSAAGAVELAATLLQLRARRTHAVHHLKTAREPDFNILHASAPLNLTGRDVALKTSFGFGGTNAAIIIAPPHCEDR